MKTQLIFFRLKKEDKKIKDRIIRCIRSLFEREEQDYEKPIRIGNSWRKNYIESDSNGDGHKTLSIEEYLMKLDHT